AQPRGGLRRSEWKDEDRCVGSSSNTSNDGAVARTRPDARDRDAVPRREAGGPRAAATGRGPAWVSSASSSTTSSSSSQQPGSCNMQARGRGGYYDDRNPLLKGTLS
ncbi:hypothetical protein QAD02_006962, partial [Eretmocerus hayati]